MDHAVEEQGGDGDIFIYRGGRAPQHVTHVLIDKSVLEIEENAFCNCHSLVQVDTQDGLRKIGGSAFYNCTSLRYINLKSAVEIDGWAFWKCEKLETLEFGDRLETIGNNAFRKCALPHLKLPSIITIGSAAFYECKRLTDIELPEERLESIGLQAFLGCERLQCIAVPLRRDLFAFNQHTQCYNQFGFCEQLTTVVLVGGVDKTVASLHMESWRTEMIAEINRINQVLPNSPAVDKTEEIRQWMEIVVDKMDHYKAEHFRYVKEGTSLLELAVWKAKLCEKEDNSLEGRTKKAKVDAHSYRRDKRITCGADIVIKNVLPFLHLE